MDFGTFIILTWIVGWIISHWIYMYRAGLGFLAMWGVPGGYRFMYFAMNLQWHTVSFGKALVWPVILALWLARGRPESPWTVVGKKHGVPLVRHVGEAMQKEGVIEETQW